MITLTYRIKPLVNNRRSIADKCWQVWDTSPNDELYPLPYRPLLSRSLNNHCIQRYERSACQECWFLLNTCPNGKHTIEIIGNPDITFQLGRQVVRHNLTVLQGQPKPISEEHYGTFRFQVFIGGWSKVGALKVSVHAPCGLTG